MYNYLKRSKEIFKKLYKIFLVVLLIYLIIRVINFPISTVAINVGDCILFIALNIIALFIFSYYYIYYFYDIYNVNMKKKDYIKCELKKISKEILMFAIYEFISCYILSFFIVGDSQNEQAINSSLNGSIFIVISTMISILVFGPILEEVIFRFHIRKLIKNKYLYIIIATFVFAAMHVYDDPNSLIYIWIYIPNSFYYTYRYYKTDDILITISLHCFNNLLATML